MSIYDFTSGKASSPMFMPHIDIYCAEPIATSMSRAKSEYTCNMHPCDRSSRCLVNCDPQACMNVCGATSHGEPMSKRAEIASVLGKQEQAVECDNRHARDGTGEIES